MDERPCSKGVSIKQRREENVLDMVHLVKAVVMNDVPISSNAGGELCSRHVKALLL